MHLLVTAWEETRPRFKELKNSIQSRDYAEKLKLVGLTGPELKLKLLVVDESYDDLQIEEEKFGSLRRANRQRKRSEILSQVNETKGKNGKNIWTLLILCWEVWVQQVCLVQTPYLNSNRL
ncbi:MAG: hypothetical protein QXY90_04900 [Candidatus Anstonellales archaeon]